MNRDKLLQILQEETDGFTEQSRLRDDVLDALEKVQELSINYTRCCEEFKCGEERVNGDVRCKTQCEQCKQDYSNDI